MSAAEVVDQIGQFQRRVVQDAMADATATYWRRRAEMYRWARPRPGDFNGTRTVDELRAHWHELTDIAKACDARAGVSAVDRWAGGDSCQDVPTARAS